MTITKFLQNRLTKVLSGITDNGSEQTVKMSPKELLHIAKGCAVLLLTFILGSSGALFSSYPFGIAFLSAADRYCAYSWLGLVLSALRSKGYALMLTSVYTGIMAIRIAVGKSGLSKASKAGHSVFLGATGELFGESVLLRCTVSCFSAFIFGLYRLITGGFLYYDLFGLLAGFLISPIVTFSLAGLFTKNDQLSKFSEISAAVLMFITVFALRGETIFGFSATFMAAMLITLWSAVSAGALRGCAAGLFAGIACGEAVWSSGSGLLSYSVGAAPCILAAAGLCMGMLWKFSKLTAAAVSCIVGLTLGLAMDGFDVMQKLMPDILASTVIFLPLAYYGVLPKLPLFTQTEHDRIGEEVMILEKKQADTTQRIRALSDSFGRLSDMIYTLSDRLRRPGIIDLKQVCDHAFDSHCQRCSLSSLCWERECTSTLDAQSKITTELYTKGRAELEDVPAYIRDRCHNIEKIVGDINAGTAELLERLIQNDRTQAFAMDYNAMSRLLAESIAGKDVEYAVNGELTDKLRRSLRYMDIPASGALCYGSRKKQIIVGGIDLSRIRMGADAIRKAVENTVHTRMMPPHFHIEDEQVTMTLSARRRFRVEHAKASGAKQQESANGDTVTIFENREDYFYTMISDGMGSGREAALTSKLCTVFCEQMLSAGNGKAVTLEMLNGFVRSRGTECSATIDLLEVDLITGEACFIKSGAAPSYVLRAGNLYKLQSKTVPIGILSTLDAEKIRFDLTEGDIILMLSDGVTQSLEDGIWLANLLTYEWEDDLGRMAEKILDNAALNHTRSDDMTVALVRVTANDGEEDAQDAG